MKTYTVYKVLPLERRTMYATCIHKPVFTSSWHWLSKLVFKFTKGHKFLSYENEYDSYPCDDSNYFTIHKKTKVLGQMESHLVKMHEYIRLKEKKAYDIAWNNYLKQLEELKNKPE